MQKNRVELLAPAGNTEGFYGAIHAGADAVYLGGSRFGARAYADNFTTEELISCIRYAHLWGRKVYLTVNTLVKETEYEEIFGYLLPYYEAGLDGVIIQDIGVFAFIREHFPGIELHVSTQMTLTDEYGAALLRDMGACRIVPARELSLQEIIRIKERTGLAIETFIHGAMCYCYSGQCLFSSILGGRSGNRGRCAQPCRLPYKVSCSERKVEECYPLSLKDMCTIEHIPRLIEAGIDSFKIEGRMKKPEYTAGVTAIYRKYIDKYYASDNKSGDAEVSKRDKQDLSNLYIRSELQDGYYDKHNGRDMVTLSSPAYSGSDETLLTHIRKKYLEVRPKKQIAVYAVFRTGSIATVTLVLEDISITAEGDVVQTAAKQPISRENIEKQLGKLGDSIFAIESMEITVSEDAFYPLRAINELRREAVSRLEEALITRNGLPVYRNDAVIPSTIGTTEDDTTDTGLSTTDMRGRIFLSVRRPEQLKVVVSMIIEDGAPVSRVYVDCDLLCSHPEKLLTQCRSLAASCEVVIALPYILRERDHAMMENSLLPLLEQFSDIFSGVLVRSLDGMGMLKTKGYQGRIYSDAGFYIWNRGALQEWEPSLEGFCLPLELKGAEQRSLLSAQLPGEKIVYGRIPMMITANCVANTTVGCQNKSGEHQVQLIDRYHKSFPVELNCTHCMNIIYNSVPLSLHGDLAKWKELTDFRLDFTIESEQDTKEITNYFLRLQENGYHSKDLKPPYQDYTTGHEKRGVE